MTVDHKEIIIQAAQKRFAHHGYSKVTMEEIAADICTSKSALYYHFTDKDALFREVLHLEQKEFVKQAKRLLKQDGSAQERLRNYFQLRLDLVARLQNLGAIGSVVPQELRPALRPLFSEFTAKDREFITQLLSLGAGKEFVTDRLEEIADLLVHILHGMRLRQRALAIPIEKVSAEIMLLADVVLNGVVRR
jgi:TetR/AcrR family transcriptional repressor of mexJK operon